MAGWVYDEATGHMYQQSQRSGSPHGQSHSYGHTSRAQSYEDRYRVGSAPARPGRHHLSPDSRGRVLYPGERYHSADDREGKHSTIATHARYLPMEYARSASMKNMNFALFMYGAVHELHSARIGTIPHMGKEMVEAKMQHLMNVIHVTCLNSNATEFKPIAWSVGRTYHNLVQAKVDSGREQWLEFDQMHRSSPHPAEMIAAEREHRAALMKAPKKTEKVEERDKSSKRACTTWNDNEVEGKCKFEADNPGLKCNRDHSCSYCTKKGNGRTVHQARFCKRKLEDGK